MFAPTQRSPRLTQKLLITVYLQNLLGHSCFPCCRLPFNWLHPSGMIDHQWILFSPKIKLRTRTVSVIFTRGNAWLLCLIRDTFSTCNCLSVWIFKKVTIPMCLRKQLKLWLTQLSCGSRRKAKLVSTLGFSGKVQEYFGNYSCFWVVMKNFHWIDFFSSLETPPLPKPLSLSFLFVQFWVCLSSDPFFYILGGSLCRLHFVGGRKAKEREKLGCFSPSLSQVAVLATFMALALDRPLWLPLVLGDHASYFSNCLFLLFLQPWGGFLLLLNLWFIVVPSVCFPSFYFTRITNFLNAIPFIFLVRS